MAVLPAEIPTGLVTAQYYFVNADNVDANTDPELTVVTGIVKLTCQAKKPLRIPTKKATIVPMVFYGEFNSSGQLVPMGQSDIGIEIPASSSTLFSPKDFTWLVEFELRDAATGYTINLESFPIYVTEGVENNLTTLAPVDSSPGTITLQGVPGPASTVPGPQGPGATSISGKAVTDAPSTYPLGLSYHSVSDSAWPLNLSTCYTVRYGGSRTVQTLIGKTSPTVYIRSETDADSWTGWEKQSSDELVTVQSITYNTNGTIATSREAGITTTYTYNSNGTVNTESRLGKVRTWTYDANGNPTGATVA